MALIYAEISLRGYGGKSPTGTLFFDLLGLEADSGFKTSPSDAAWKAARVVLVEVSINDCKATSEPHEEFARRISAGLHRAANWLSSRQEALDTWRKGGREADVLIGGWLEDNQLDFELQPEFLSQCGRLRLPIRICTND